MVIPLPARKPYLIQTVSGENLGVLLSLRETWNPGDEFALKGQRLRVTAMVPVEPETSEWVARLTVEPV